MYRLVSLREQPKLDAYARIQSAACLRSHRRRPFPWPPGRRGKEGTPPQPDCRTTSSSRSWLVSQLTTSQHSSVAPSRVSPGGPLWPTSLSSGVAGRREHATLHPSSASLAGHGAVQEHAWTVHRLSSRRLNLPSIHAAASPAPLALAPLTAY